MPAMKYTFSKGDIIMTMTLPLDTMSVDDRIQIMESIWGSFVQNPDEMDSPAWHSDVLSAREAKVSNGTAQYSDWDEAKLRIRSAVQS